MRNAAYHPSQYAGAGGGLVPVVGDDWVRSSRYWGRWLKRVAESRKPISTIYCACEVPVGVIDKTEPKALIPAWLSERAGEGAEYAFLVPFTQPGASPRCTKGTAQSLRPEVVGMKRCVRPRSRMRCEVCVGPKHLNAPQNLRVLGLIATDCVGDRSLGARWSLPSKH